MLYLHYCKRYLITSLAAFLFALYKASPDFARMITWQRLEEDTDHLNDFVGNKTLPSYEAWLKAIETLQQKNVIRDDLEAKLLLIFIFSSLSGVYTEEQAYFNALQERKQQYVHLVINAVCAGLMPRAKK